MPSSKLQSTIANNAFHLEQYLRNGDPHELKDDTWTTWKAFESKLKILLGIEQSVTDPLIEDIKKDLKCDRGREIDCNVSALKIIDLRGRYPNLAGIGKKRLAGQNISMNIDESKKIASSVPTQLVPLQTPSGGGNNDVYLHK